jgi:hypothetical protein
MIKNQIKTNPDENPNKVLGTNRKKRKDFSAIYKLPLLTNETPKGSFLSVYDPLSSL